MTSAVVFAYHDVGVRCLEALISAGIRVPLVVTHADDPNEARWFESVARVAENHGIPVAIASESEPAVLDRRLSDLRPDFIFSFYYRSLLSPATLALASRGALNMHGSLLPQYRGRAPVNWAILNGEIRTGATLHYMVARADAGDIVDQMAVPILNDDDARTVMAKVTLAAEIVLTRSLPQLIEGVAPRVPQRLNEGRYFGRRGPEDGRIDWRGNARTIHNLIRAVAPPFPGAFTDLDTGRLWIHRSRVERSVSTGPESPRLVGGDGRCFAVCADGSLLRILAVATEAGPLAIESLTCGGHPVPLR